MKSFCRSPHLIMRREKGGGLVFNSNNAITIEVDKQAFRLLELIDGTRKLKNIFCQIKSEIRTAMVWQDFFEVVTTLLGHGFIVRNSKIAENCFSRPVEPWFTGTALSAPEKVHLMLTSECNLSCKGCYAKQVKGTDLTTEQIMELVDQLSQMKVLQLAIGGGEPFLRKDIVEITQYASQNNILPNITTNGTLLNDEIASRLRPFIGKLQFSIIAPTMEMNDKYRSIGAWNGFLKGFQVARNNKLGFGVNVLVTRKSLSFLPQLIKLILKQGTTEVNILRPKPTSSQNSWFLENQLGTEDLKILKTVLSILQQEWPRLNLTVDCALTSLMDNLPEKFRQKHGIFGCTASKRFLTIHSNGNVYPCSFLDWDFLCLGNIQEHTFREIWEKSTTFTTRMKSWQNKQDPKKIIECCSAITLANLQALV